MTRKRALRPSKKQKNIFKQKKVLYLGIIFVIIVITSATIVLLQSEPNNSSSLPSDGTWQFAMDTSTAHVGSYGEYSTGYIPTLVIIDTNGNIIHKEAGVHQKAELMDYIKQAQNPSSSQNLGSAPDFTLKTLSGETFKLSENKGKVVILDFMAVRCPPCHQQMPELFELKKELGDSIVILSIDVDGESGSETQDDLRDSFGEYIKE